MVATRGRFRPPGAIAPPPGASADERPLHLHIAPGTSLAAEGLETRRAAVQAAAEMVKGLRPLAPVLSQRVPVGVDFPHPAFDLPARLRGPEGAYLAHIAAETGATLRLAGRGAGGADESAEALHVRVEAPQPKARRRCRATVAAAHGGSLLLVEC